MLRSRTIAALTIGATLWVAPAFVVATAQIGQSFRANVDLVAVDVLVLDRAGKPVTDLRASDLVLKVGGRPREIRQFDYVGATREARTPVNGRTRLPAPFGSNDTAGTGRLVVIVIDEEHIRPGEGKNTFDAAGRFLDRLNATDRVALVTVPTGGVRVDATTNHDRVRHALSRLVGKAPSIAGQWNVSLGEALLVLAEQTDSDRPRTAELQARECRFASPGSSCQGAVVQEALRIARAEERTTRATMRSMKDLLTGLIGIDAPKTVLLISGALVGGREFVEELRDVTRAVALARAQLYVLQPYQALLDVSSRETPISTGEDDRVRTAGLADLAADTGGVLFRLTGSGDNAFNQIADEVSSHYLLGFRPEANERNGKQHKIELTSTRAGVTLRARPMFVIDTAKPSEQTLNARAIVRNSSAHADLALRAAAFHFRDADRTSIKVVASLETVDPADVLTSAAFALLDPQGRIVSAWEEDGASVVVRPLVTAAVLPAGDYKLRVAAVDTRGRRGTVDYEFSGNLTDVGPFKVNAPMFGTVEQGAFRPGLQNDVDAKDVTAYLELYAVGDVQGKVLSVRFEIAGDAEAKAIVSTPARLLGTKDSDRWVATALMDIASLPPGDYAGRAVVTLDGEPIGQVARTLRRVR